MLKRSESSQGKTMKLCKFKGCPRCKGDLLVDRDYWQVWYEYCLQCGFQRDYQVSITNISAQDNHIENGALLNMKKTKTTASRTATKRTQRRKKSKK